MGKVGVKYLPQLAIKLHGVESIHGPTGHFAADAHVMKAAITALDAND
jgi:hypothetical protein